MPRHVLVVDDEAGVRFTVREVLESAGFEVSDASSASEGFDRVRRGGVDLVVSDYRMPGRTGLELLGDLASLPDAPPLVMLTAHGNERLAVSAMKQGAVDYLAKPFDPDELVLVVEKNLRVVRLRRENEQLKADKVLGRTMVFRSVALQQVARIVERVARRDVTVLITGETGTGKELVARALVRGSARADAPFVSFNCAGLPETLIGSELFGHSKGAFTGAASARRGLIREAHGGTLFLDEVGELPLTAQAQLLRVLQEREVRPVGTDRAEPVDVRFIAATHRDLQAMCDDGRFRRDLYYRLNVVPITLPALRDRREDIAPLVEHFVDRCASRFGLGTVQVDPGFVAQLQMREWPGNVRELENLIERLVTLMPGNRLTGSPLNTRSEAIPEPNGLSLKQRVDGFERALIDQALTSAAGNQSEAARTLGVSRPTLIGELKKYGLA